MESKEFKALMEAYTSIYEKKEDPEMEEGEGKESEKDEGGKHKEGKHPKGKEEKGEKVTEKEGKEGKEGKEEKKMKEEVELDEEAPKRIGLQPASPRLMKNAGPAKVHDPSKIKDKKVKRVEEEFEGDLFDTILEYLVAEGYADTNKAALAIMANMSEEWKQSIVEADSMAAFQARREARLARQRKREGRPSGGGDFGHDYSKPRAQADAEREQRMKDFINKKN